MRAFGGQLLNEILCDTDEVPLTMQSEPMLPFYPMQRARVEARRCFHEALLQQRIMNMPGSRPRADDDAKLAVGDTVDFYRDPINKGVSGWRGPVPLIAIRSDMHTIKWQGVHMDILS